MKNPTNIMEYIIYFPIDYTLHQVLDYLDTIPEKCFWSFSPKDGSYTIAIECQLT